MSRPWGGTAGRTPGEPVPLICAYRRPALDRAKERALLALAQDRVSRDITSIETEFCFYISSLEPLTDRERGVLLWLLSETFEPWFFSSDPFLAQGPGSLVLEVGPRMNFTTAWSTNAVSVCHACGIAKVDRIERSRRYSLVFRAGSAVPDRSSDAVMGFLSLVHDRMTECHYPERLRSFESGIRPEPVYEVRVLEDGEKAIGEINRRLGLGLDDWDIDYYHRLFSQDLRRNPTSVECFDLGQSNSEHSRHWFFRGRLVIDGRETPENLMEIVKEPYRLNPNNSVIAFSDNSSAIRGYRVATILPEKPGRPSAFRDRQTAHHITFTAETHNFPSGVAPFPGAETGTGGRIRDVQAVGRGGLVIAGTAAYCVGNLLIPGYDLPWEDKSFVYPGNLATPLRIEIEASNGASDYGNKFGEPVIQGYTRSFGIRLPNGERREWVKPVMFTGGIGQMDSAHVQKGEPETGMFVVKVGGPAYRIGIGGGAASSMIQGENVAELDFNAVQRGDAEMEQKMNRVVRACVELGEDNPIVSIHDQGAGGNCNVLKELIYPAGARIEVRRIPLGDQTLSVLEIWGAEYQESNALLIRPEAAGLFGDLCSREKVPCAFVGQVTGDGYVVLHDETDGSLPVNLDLKKVLGEMPRKTFELVRARPVLRPLDLPEGLTVRAALDRVLRLVSVGSKRFLTNKVDRSVTGLIARQQCAGPLLLTVSDVAVVAQSHFSLTGAATAIGEQPVKGLIDPAAMARLSVAEALTNIVWARLSSLEDIRCSGNWMWPAKLPGEGAALYDAAVAMRDIMISLGIAVDGGKDSLSMAAVVSEGGKTEIVKAPGALVISAYAPCPDIAKVVTPDLKQPGTGRLLWIDIGKGKGRLGGSAFAQVYGQVGSEAPDIDDPLLLKSAFLSVQQLIDEGLILSGHDVSDGGLITTLLEMAFSGNCGAEVSLPGTDAVRTLFAEEAGLVIEYLPEHEERVKKVLEGHGVGFSMIGGASNGYSVRVSSGGALVLDDDIRRLRSIWEETSYRLELLQADTECVEEEKKNIADRTGPSFSLGFRPESTQAGILSAPVKPRVAVIREEGSNGDREMASAFHHSGFEVWDVAMTDLLSGTVSLDGFRGVAFVGGFSYADVLDSAKGWAGVIRFHDRLFGQFKRFYERKDTFSLGVCNGCQLMALLGWVPWQGLDDIVQPRFIRNRSRRFESRFSAVRILPSPAVMLRGMENSVLGIWVAHGEGQAHFPDRAIREKVLAGNLAPVRYVDDLGNVTAAYPFNPNGSPDGIAALCSPDGRHLAIMPHPERTFLKWQWPWMPEEWKKDLMASPWLRLFQNARAWCDEVQ